jgi:hypothetical protein
MKGRFIFKWFPLVILAGLLLSGCVIENTIDTRRQERMNAYNAMPPDIRAAVDAGQLKAGMDANAVYIAWGAPAQILNGGDASGETTTWIYRGVYTQVVSFYGPYRVHYAYTPVSYTRAQVVFSDRLVRNWQTFPSPAY